MTMNDQSEKSISILIIELENFFGDITTSTVTSTVLLMSMLQMLLLFLQQLLQQLRLSFQPKEHDSEISLSIDQRQCRLLSDLNSRSRDKVVMGAKWSKYTKTNTYGLNFSKVELSLSEVIHRGTDKPLLENVKEDPPKKISSDGLVPIIPEIISTSRQRVAPPAMRGQPKPSVNQGHISFQRCMLTEF
ncbi:hypothetical protein GQX74_000419 [Glossina fuscipes]|nr:hypothetical protein GQX74_000419 [Glossina fuscipes]